MNFVRRSDGAAWLLCVFIASCDATGAAHDASSVDEIDTWTAEDAADAVAGAVDGGIGDAGFAADVRPDISGREEDTPDATRAETPAAEPCGELACADAKCAPFGQVLALGRDHTCVITESSRVCCWGSSEYGQAGDGSVATVKRRAQRVPGLDGVAGIAAGEHHTCAIVGSSREVWCWGMTDQVAAKYLAADERRRWELPRKFSREELLLSTSPSGVGADTSPRKIPGLSDVELVSCGSAHCCAVASSGVTVCFGWLTDDVGESRGTLTEVPLLYGATELVSRGRVTYGLAPGGAVVFFRFSDDATVTTMAVDGLPAAQGIATGEIEACALPAAGDAVWCWKHAQGGVLKQTGTPIGVVGVRHTGVAARALTMEDFVACLVGNDETLRCWMSNFDDEGPGEVTDSATWPLESVIAPPVRVLSSGPAHTCVVTTDGATLCHGMDEWGQSGEPFPGGLSPQPLQAPYHPWMELLTLRPDAAIRGLSTTRGQSSVLYDVGESIWGAAAAQHGLHDGNTIFRSYWEHAYGAPHGPAAVDLIFRLRGETPPESVASWTPGGSLVTFATKDGEILFPSPDLLPSNALFDLWPMPWPSEVVHVTVGHEHICFHHQPGHVSCRGLNTHGQCGAPPSGSELVSTAQPIPGLAVPIALAAGARHTCALAHDGRVLCWGDNTYLQLGSAEVLDGTHVPFEVVLPWAAAGLVVGGWHSCAWNEQHDLWCWGADLHGESSGVDRSVDSPETRLPGPTLDWAPEAVTAGHGFTCAIDADMQGWCWGANGYAQLGTGDQIASGSPRQVDIPPGLVSVSAGYHHACAWDVEDNVYCWGRAAEGQLGLGYPWLSKLVTVRGMELPKGMDPWLPEGPWPEVPEE